METGYPVLCAIRLLVRPGLRLGLTSAGHLDTLRHHAYLWPSRNMVMPTYRTAFAIAILMFAASGAAIVARPSAKLANEIPAISL